LRSLENLPSHPKDDIKKVAGPNVLRALRGAEQVAKKLQTSAAK
jgi:hypothetical protein